MADDYLVGPPIVPRPAPDDLDRAEREMRELNRLAALFGRTITGAFAQGSASGKSFDDTLKRLYMRLSDVAMQAALRPLEKQASSILTKIFSGIFTWPPKAKGGSGDGRSDIPAGFLSIQPFASGGVIGTPTYFPLSSGGLGLAGEAGPEAILPLTRTAGGKLGVAAAGGAPSASIVVNIATPDADSFRRSEVYVTGQIARAVARGQRGL